KINKKLDIQNRLFNQVLAETIVDPETGEVLAQKGDKLDSKLLNNIIPYLEREEDKLGEDVKEPQDAVLDEPIRLQSMEVADTTDRDGERTLKVFGNAGLEKTVQHITSVDILASMSYFFNLLHGVGNTVEIVHLSNLRLRSVGELLQKKVRMG